LLSPVFIAFIASLRPPLALAHLQLHIGLLVRITALDLTNSFFTRAPHSSCSYWWLSLAKTLKKKKKGKKKKESDNECGRSEQGWRREAGRPGSTTHDRGVFTIDAAVELVLGVFPPSCMFLEFGGEYGLYS
jgi:hypothetical protein